MSVEIALVNPLPEPITFEVVLTGDGLLGDDVDDVDALLRQHHAYLAAVARGRAQLTRQISLSRHEGVLISVR